MTISQILDHWQKARSPAGLTKGTADSEVLALAAFAAIMLGQRAKDCKRTEIEHACYDFITILNKEREGTSDKEYRMRAKP
jgi:hypothetical protein